MFGVALVPGLVMLAKPWPMPVSVTYHQHHIHPVRQIWYSVDESERIFVVKVQDLKGIFRRKCVLEVQRVLKGKSVPERLEIPLGTLCGTDDVGKRFVIFQEEPDRKSTETTLGQYYSTDLARLGGGADLYVQRVSEIVRLRAAGGKLKDEHYEIIQSWVARGKRLYTWEFHARQEPLKDLLREQEDPRARELLEKLHPY